MEAKNIRTEKGNPSPSQNGQGSTYLIPLDDMPQGIVSGENGELIIEGLFTTDEQGLIIKVDRISMRKPHDRNDPLQSKIEQGLDIEIKLSK